MASTADLPAEAALPSSSDDEELRKQLPGYVDDDMAAAILSIVTTFERDDKPTRDRQVRGWKRNHQFWRGIQYTFWSELARDWQSPLTEVESDPGAYLNPAIFAKVVNIYKAHGESIIAALSQSVPKNLYFPDDADKSDDIVTARIATKIEKLIMKHNEADMLLMRTLFLLYNEGLVGAYVAQKADPKFGMGKIPIFGTKSRTRVQGHCPNCGTLLSERTDESDITDKIVPATSSQSTPQGGPDSDNLTGSQYEQPPNSASSDGEPEESEGDKLIAPQFCNQCDTDVEPSESRSDLGPKKYIKSYEQVAKERTVVQMYGPLNMKVATFATNQDETPYLILEKDIHFTKAQSMYPLIAEKIRPANDPDKYDRWGRSSIELAGDVNPGLVTMRQCWLRPESYYILGVSGRMDDIAALMKKFPDGCYAVFIDTVFAEAFNENLDDSWTLTISPTSTYIHAEPHGKSYIPIQEMRNELVNLTLQTIQYGIPETFVEASVLDFEAYRQVQADPGNVFPIKLRAGMTADNAFHTLKTATVSQEIVDFKKWIDDDGELVLGAFPSIYGGEQEAGSKTLGEYQQSRQMALQRLSIPWKTVSSFWANFSGKAVKKFIKAAIAAGEDTRTVQAAGNSFINTWIRVADMKGQIGSVEPETSDQFPLSWAEKWQRIVNLLQVASQGAPQIAQTLFSPENSEFMAEMIGLPDLKIPAADERNWQMEEIQMMLKGANAPIDTDTDDDDIHIKVCKAWLISPMGQMTKVDNPDGYKLIVGHMQAHIQNQQAKATPPPTPPGPPGNGTPAPGPPNIAAAGGLPPVGPPPSIQAPGNGGVR